MEEIKLTPEEKKRLEELIKLIKSIEREIERATRVGIDVTAERKELAELRRLRDRLLMEYG